MWHYTKALVMMVRVEMMVVVIVVIIDRSVVTGRVIRGLRSCW